MVIKTKPTRGGVKPAGLISPEYMENSQRSNSSTRSVNLLPIKKALAVSPTPKQRPSALKKQQTAPKRAPPPSPETAMGKPRTNKNKTVSRKVSFNTVSIYHVLSRNEYTQAERQATWFNADEFTKIRNSAMALAKSIDFLTTAQQKSDLRGLERVMKHNLKKHTARRRALFDEIAFLRKKGFHTVSPTDLATLFQSYTANSQLEARGMARDDEKRARDCYSEDVDFMKLFFDLYGGNAMMCSKEAGAVKTPKSNKRQSFSKRIKTKKEAGTNAKQPQRLVTTTTVDTTSRGIEQKQRFREGISQRPVAARSLR